MIHLLTILISLVCTTNTTPSIKNTIQIEEVIVEFSEKAIGIESGQPIFAQSTKIWVSNPTKEDYWMYINEEQKELTKEKVEITDLEPGTYTLMILPTEESTEEKRTIGFTIK